MTATTITGLDLPRLPVMTKAQMMEHFDAVHSSGLGAATAVAPPVRMIPPRPACPPPRSSGGLTPPSRPPCSPTRPSWPSWPSWPAGHLAAGRRARP